MDEHGQQLEPNLERDEPLFRSSKTVPFTANCNTASLGAFRICGNELPVSIRSFGPDRFDASAAVPKHYIRILFLHSIPEPLDRVDHVHSIGDRQAFELITVSLHQVNGFFCRSMSEPDDCAAARNAATLSSADTLLRMHLANSRRPSCV